MPDKSFEQSIDFYQVATPTGPVWLPLVEVDLVRANGSKVRLPLLFDTGASTMTLRHDLYPLLGLTAWDSGTPVDTLTAGDTAPVVVYRYDATFEFLGKTINCPVQLARLPSNPLYVGLFGRDQMFNHFGFGFWETPHLLFATVSP